MVQFTHDISSTPPLIFNGDQNAKFGFDFRHQSPLKRSGFKTQRHIRKLKQATSTQMICLNT